MHNDWSKRDRNIHDIIIRNVIAYSNLCFVIRLLPANAKIWNVIIDGVIEQVHDGCRNYGTIVMGDNSYGINPKDGLTNITLSNIICNSDNRIVVWEYLKDSLITNAVNKAPGKSVFTVGREDGLNNVKTVNLLTTED